MTALINTIVGAASSAVEKITGTLQAKSGSAGAAGEFANVLANMTGSVAPAAIQAARPRELRLGGEAELGQADLLDASDEAGTQQGVLLLTQPTLDARVVLANRELAIEEASLLTSEEADVEEEDADIELLTELDVGAITEPNADLEGLRPEFAQRLDRVIDRMQSEFGHKVTVVEAHRTQARQDHLFEQGRTKPGPVVTWTRNSNHTQGKAVDVMIDGSYNNPKGYQRLGQIAAEEGLRTLGPRDPGHIELPGNVNLNSDTRIADALGLPRESFGPARAPVRSGGIARVAEVARVAEIAQVAQVAQVARVSDPTRSQPLSPADSGIKSGQIPLPNLATPEISAAQLQGAVNSAPTIAQPGDVSSTLSATADSTAAALAAATQSGNGGASGEGSQSRREGQRESLSTAEAEIFRADAGLGRAFTTGTTKGAEFVGGTDAVQRAAQILAMKENAEAGPINHMLLRLDTPDGGQDRIRVDLRGLNVDTTLNIGNAKEADHLASRIGDLRQSLERHGLEAEAVKIRTNPTIATDRAEAARAAYTNAEVDAGRQTSSGRSGADSGGRDTWRESQDNLRRDSGNSRERSRREPRKEENK